MGAMVDGYVEGALSTPATRMASIRRTLRKTELENQLRRRHLHSRERKGELKVYADNNARPYVKPFIL